MEAAAAGTPVVAFRRGALPEVVRDGVTGFLAQDAVEAVLAMQNISRIDPRACMLHAQKNFSAGKMAERYSSLYEQLTCAKRAVRSA
jgi:glycosyltransferase involved in cell wall biosynthesis